MNSRQNSNNRNQTSSKQRSINIGINYTGSKQALAGCVSDSVRMASLMLKLGVDDVVLMIDHDFNNLQRVTIPSDLQEVKNNKNKVIIELPTKNRILNQIRRAVRDTSINTLFISYAGHGMQGLRNRSNTEESDGRDEYICSLSNNGKFVKSINNFISDDELIKTINDAGQRRDPNSPLVITYMFDCCHSGTVFDLPYNQIKLPKGIEYRTEPRNKLNQDHITISGWSGCQDNQLSREDRINYFIAEGRCTKSFATAIEKAILEPMNKQTNKSRPEITHFDLHNLIMKIMYQIDQTDDNVISTADDYQVINYSSSRNIGLDKSGRKIVTQAFVPGTSFKSYSYDDIKRVIDKSKYPNIMITDRDPIDL